MKSDRNKKQQKVDNMILETKFNIGESVWTIGTFNWPSKAYKVSEKMIIGQVRKKVTSSPRIDENTMFSNYAPHNGEEEQYMCVETGIGSGTLHDVDKLFRTKEDAEVEAKRLNAYRLKDDGLYSAERK